MGKDSALNSPREMPATKRKWQALKIEEKNNQLQFGTAKCEIWMVPWAPQKTALKP